MIKCIVAITLALPPSAAIGQSICRIYEYAELRDMRQEKLQEMNCQYYAAMAESVRLSVENLKAGRTFASQMNRADGNRCAQEMTRMENILDSKYGVKELPKCAPKSQ